MEKLAGRIGQIFTSMFSYSNSEQQLNSFDLVRRKLWFIKANAIDSSINPIILNAIETDQVRVCFLFDNFDHLIKEENVEKSEEKIQEIYRNILHLITDNNLAIRLIFISSRHVDLPVPKIRLTYPSDSKLEDFVFKKIVKEIEENPLLEACLLRVFVGNDASVNLEKLQRRLASHIIAIMSVEVKDFRTYEAIAKKVIHFALKDLEKATEVKAKQTQEVIFTNATAMLKMFFINPKAAFRHLNDLKNDLQVLRDDNPSLYNPDQPVTKNDSYKSELRLQDKFNLPPIPAFVLVACFICNCSTESKDILNLKHVQGTKTARLNSQQNKKQNKRNPKPANKTRIEAMAQHLMSIAYEGQKMVRELRLKHHSLQFILSYKLLEDFRLIKR